MLDSARSSPFWGWNSYDGYVNRLNEGEFLENLRYFIRYLKPAGYEFFVIDAGWYLQEDGSPLLDRHGRPLPAPHLFPRGFAPLIEACHAAGVKFGLHLMRGIFEEAAQAGCTVAGIAIPCAEILNRDPEDRCPWRGSLNLFGVQPHCRGAQEYYDSLLDLYCRNWQVDFLKYDDIQRNGGELALVIRAAEKTPRTVTLSLSPGDYPYRSAALPLHAYTGANSMRITHDVWDRQRDIDDLFDAWNHYSAKEEWRPHHFFFDMDMLPFGALMSHPPDLGDELEYMPDRETYAPHRCRFTDAQKRTLLTQHAMGASPLMAGGCIASYTPYERALLCSPGMLACSRNGVTGHWVGTVGAAQVYRTPHRTRGGQMGWTAVFNRSGRPLRTALSREALGLAGAGRCALYDIWGDRALDALGAGDTLALSLAAHDVLFMKYERE